MMHGSPPAQALNQAVPDPSPELLARASSLRRHAIDLAQCSDQQRQDALRAMADALELLGDSQLYCVQPYSVDRTSAVLALC